MEVPNRQEQLDALARKYLADPEPKPNGNGRRAAGPPPQLSDDEITSLCRKAKNAAKFSDLYDAGDAAGYDGDESRADLALASMFAFYTQEPEQIERLIDGSALGRRAKWRGRADYRKRTVDYALRNLRETYTPRPNEHPPEQDRDAPIYSHHIDGGFGENKKPLPIKTVEDILAEAGEEVPWVVENVLARGSLTEFSGLAKRGGKTTFWCHAIAAGARGEDHAGFSTEPAKYLYLTEQGNNFAQPLRESGLGEHPDHIRVLQFKDVSALKWNTLIQQAGAEAKRLGLDVLVVDTFAVFAGLKGSEENDSGPVADRMRVLRLVAQKHGIAVLLIRHAGKDGTPRGSSAFEAEADICVALSRPEGRHAPSVRKITGIGRYGEWERNIQLVDGRYVSLGADDKIEFNRAVKFIKAVLPAAPDGGMRKQDILDKRAGADEEVSASTLDRALTWLVKQGDVGEKQLPNERGRPKVYWLAYKPPPGGDDGGFIYSHQTPPVYGENKPEPENGESTSSFDGALDGFDDPVAEFLSAPPAWFVSQAARYSREGEPERLLNPLASALAYAVYASATRYEEVVPAVRAWVARNDFGEGRGA